jgi:hypothetical protein
MELIIKVLPALLENCLCLVEDVVKRLLAWTWWGLEVTGDVMVNEPVQGKEIILLGHPAS